MNFQHKSTTMDARSAAFEILQRVDEGGYADRLLDSFLQRNPTLDSREKGLLTELVYGVLRLRGRIDFALSHFSRQPLHKLEAPARLLLRLGQPVKGGFVHQERLVHEPQRHIARRGIALDLFVDPVGHE